LLHRGTFENGARRSPRKAQGPEPASRLPSRGRLHGTHAVCGFAAHGAAGAKYPFSSPPTHLVRDRRLSRCRTRIGILSSFRMKGARRGGNENPSGTQAREGRTEPNGAAVRPLRLLEPARALRRCRDFPGARCASVWRLLRLSLRFSRSASGRCRGMIALRGEVAARRRRGWGDARARSLPRSAT